MSKMLNKQIADLKTKYQDERMNYAKERLAFEVTKLVHGEEKAIEAQKQAKAAFSGGMSNDMPTMEIENPNSVAELLVAVNQAKSKGEAKRLIEGGGVSINDTKITDPFANIPEEALNNKEFILHKGKKVHIKVVIK